MAAAHTPATHGPAWPTIAGAVDGLLRQFDTNHDSAITLAEIAGVLDPGGHHPDTMNTVVRHLVSLIDGNADGTLTKAELTTAVTSLDFNGDGSLSPADLGPEAAQAGLAPLLAVLLHGGSVPGGHGDDDLPEPPGPPAPPPAAGPKAPTVEQVVDVLTARFDANDDAALTLAELLAVVDPKGRHAKVDTALTALVDALDQNHDGSLNRAELTAGVATLDTDGNGRLDHRDHVPGPPVDHDTVDLIGVLLPHLRDFDAATLALAG